MRRRILYILTIVAFFFPLSTEVQAQEGSPYKGETIHICILGPYAPLIQQYGNRFFSETGIRVNIIDLPNRVTLYQKQITSFIAQVGAFDVVQFSPSWMVSYINFLEPLGPLVEKNALDFKREDLMPVCTEFFADWMYTWYGMPINVFPYILYYRKDLFKDSDYKPKFRKRYGYELKPPETWDQYLDIAGFFNNWDWDNDGQIEYGTASASLEGGILMEFLARFAGFKGKYFDDKMNASINSKRGFLALENLLVSIRHGHPETRSFGYDQVRDIFLNGDISLAFSWPYLAKLAEDPTLSRVAGKIGYLPGLSGYLDNPKQSVVADGWSLGIPKDSKHKDAALCFVWYLTRSDISLNMVKDSYVDQGVPSLCPYRISHFASPEFRALWPGSYEYFEAIAESLINGLPSLSTIGMRKYMDLLKSRLEQAISDEITSEQALNYAAKEWNEITGKLVGGEE